MKEPGTIMRGPEILVRSIGIPAIDDKYGNLWQYHSQSDRHSKIACWGILYDLLNVCTLLQSHIKRGAVGFGINHVMWNFRTSRKKNLDLVICTPGTDVVQQKCFSDLVEHYKINLTLEEADKLRSLPAFLQMPVGSVHLALEAKACMTEHVKALPRLYDELNSSHLAIHGSSDFAIAAGFAMVNLSDTFISTGRNKYNLGISSPTISKHKQPIACARTIKALRDIPRRTQSGVEGFDAFGIVVVECRNDGSPINVISHDPAPKTDEIFHYDQLIRRIAHNYESKFSSL